MNSNEPRHPPGSPEDWLAHAESDLAMARLASGSHDILPEQICFHAQQTAEKGLKAVLLSGGVEFPWTHDLDALMDIVAGHGLPFPAEFTELGDLSTYAVETRYPGASEPVTVGEANEAIALAERVLQWARRMLHERGAETR